MNANQIVELIERYIVLDALIEDARRQSRAGKFGETLPAEAALARVAALREQRDLAGALNSALDARYAVSVTVFGNAPVEFWLPAHERIAWAFVEHALERDLWLNEAGDADDANPRRDTFAPRPAPTGAHENIPY